MFPEKEHCWSTWKSFFSENSREHSGGAISVPENGAILPYLHEDHNVLN